MRKSNGKMKTGITIIVSLVIILSLSQFVFANTWTNTGVGITKNDTIKYSRELYVPTNSIDFCIIANCGNTGSGLKVILQKKIQGQYWLSLDEYTINQSTYLERYYGKVTGTYRLKITHLNTNYKSVGYASIGYETR